MSIEISSRLFDGPHLIKEWSYLKYPILTIQNTNAGLKKLVLEVIFL